MSTSNLEKQPPEKQWQSKQWLEEAPTIFLLLLCYAAYVVITVYTTSIGPSAALVLLTLVLVLHSSLQHEFLHGHPTPNQVFNDFLVSPAPGLLVRDTHLDHHRNELLTDPYDDPESNFIDPLVWNQLPGWRQTIARYNSTLLGRIIIGPLVGMFSFYRNDISKIRNGERRVAYSYLHHLVWIAPVLAWHLTMSSMPTWAYLLAAYLAMSILKIRTFLEHTASERVAERSVLIEDRGPLAFLFLNNNYHAVHHAHPGIVWHQLPARFNERKDLFLNRNGGYWFRSYWSVFKLYLFKRKDSVAHPMMEGYQPERHRSDVQKNNDKPPHN